MQPAEHLCPSGFRVSGPPSRGGRRGVIPAQNLPWTGKNVRAKFHQDWCGVWISISPLQTDKQTNICTPIFLPP